MGLSSPAFRRPGCMKRLSKVKIRKGNPPSIRVFPFVLQGGQEIGSAVGTKEFVVLDHGRYADTRRRQRIFNPDYPGAEANSYRIRQSDMRRKGKRDFQLRAGLHGTVEIKEYAAGADVLRFGVEFAGAFQAHHRGKAHVKAPHGPPFL